MIYFIIISTCSKLYMARKQSHAVIHTYFHTAERKQKKTYPFCFLHFEFVAKASLLEGHFLLREFCVLFALSCQGQLKVVLVASLLGRRLPLDLCDSAVGVRDQRVQVILRQLVSCGIDVTHSSGEWWVVIYQLCKSLAQ